MVNSKINFKLDPSKVERARRMSGGSGANITPRNKLKDRQPQQNAGELLVKNIAGKLNHDDYLQRLDAAEKLEQLALTGEDISGAFSALREASNDYSPYVRDAAQKAIKTIKEIKRGGARKQENVDVYPFVNFRGFDLNLIEAINQNQSTKKKAIQKIKNIAKADMDHVDKKTKVSIVVNVTEVLTDKKVMGDLEESVKRDIKEIVRKFENDADGGIRSVARVALKGLYKP